MKTSKQPSKLIKPNRRHLLVQLGLTAGLVVLVLAGRLVLPTYHANRFIEAIRADDVETIESLFKPSDNKLELGAPSDQLTFRAIYCQLDKTSVPRIEPISLANILYGQRRIKISPESTLSAYPFYVTQWNVRDYKSLKL